MNIRHITYSIKLWNVLSQSTQESNSIFESKRVVDRMNNIYRDLL